MTVKYINSSMPGRSELNSAAGGFVSLMDELLVELGWTIAFSSGGVRAYRNDNTLPGSSGCYVRIDNTSATEITIRAYKTMSDINTGTGGVGLAANSVYNTPLYIPVCLASYEMKKWEIIGDERTFYMSFQGDEALGHQEMFFLFGAGDYDSAVPGNTYNYFVGACSQNFFTSYGDFLSGGLTYSSFIPMDLDLNPAPSTCVYFPAMLVGFPSGRTSQFPAPENTAYGWVTMPAFLQVQSSNQLYGKLRGVLLSMNGLPSTMFQQTPITLEGFSLPHRVLGCTYYAPRANMLVSQDDW